MNWKILSGVGTVVGAAVGAVGGYFVARRQLELYYAELAASEIAEAKNFYSTFYKSGEDATPEGALQKRHPGALLDPQAKAETPEEAEANANQGAANFAREIIEKSRYGQPTAPAAKVGPPRIISREEYFENAWEYSQTSITYYADGALVDEDEDLVENIDLTVGEANLKRFGRKSGDENVVYVINDRVRVLYEICRDEMTYAELIDLKGA